MAVLRRLILLGALAVGAALSVPALHRQNPDLFEAILRMPRQGGGEPASGSRFNPERNGGAEVLLGRKVRLPADAQGHYIADFKLNGRAVTGLVDTGATLVAINQSTARRIGLKVAASDFRYEVDTANGKARAGAVTLESLQIGRIRVDNVQAMVLEDRALATTLVGMSFLGRLARFEVEGGSLVLEQ
ncbi:TIGR02281 family clan AA aspartic protease [Chelativorans sp.]|uniref:TIGR02281 family clan AA aspartic protease n=1 Tax=Chelativorans sp. TaxID=2203393 RepID=UPI002811F8AB|nr:TIGR02281 family clan AA aspartic protease [Chelativorans sp.]